MAGETRKETVNTWNEGLIMDLNPLNTPSNVLTDCVNGTLITYDGNEYSLQNDKGNFKLKYSELPIGFVPVGSASYGDILYIVSYNPDTKETEVGSFPSPIQIESSSESEERVVESPITKYRKEKGYSDTDTVYINYEDLISKTYNALIVFDSSSTGEDLMLHIGDEFSFETTASKYNYESIQYFVVTDENEIINITNEVTHAPISDSEQNFRYVIWECPGWLAIKWKLPEIVDFQIIPRSINPISGQSTINFQISSQDSDLKTAFDKKNISIEDNMVSVSGTDYNINKYDSISYYTISKTGIYNISELTSNLQIDAKPLLDVGKNTYIRYPKSTHVIDLTNVFSENNVHIAEEYFTYTVDKNTITLCFDVDAPVVSTGNIQMKICFNKFFECVKMSNIRGGTNKPIFKFTWVSDNFDYYNGPGKQIIQYTFDNNSMLENVLVIGIKLTDGYNEKIIYKTVINSELINNFTEDDYKDFSDIPMDIWGKYIPDLQLDYFNKTGNEYLNVGTTWYSTTLNTCPYEIDDSNLDSYYWNSKIDYTTIPGFVTKSNFKNITKESISYNFNVIRGDQNPELIENNIKFWWKLKQKYLYNFLNPEFNLNYSLNIFSDIATQFLNGKPLDSESETRNDVYHNLEVNQDLSTAKFDFKFEIGKQLFNTKKLNEEDTYSSVQSDLDYIINPWDYNSLKDNFTQKISENSSLKKNAVLAINSDGVYKATIISSRNRKTEDDLITELCTAIKSKWETIENHKPYYIAEHGYGTRYGVSNGYQIKSVFDYACELITGVGPENYWTEDKLGNWITYAFNENPKYPSIYYIDGKPQNPYYDPKWSLETIYNSDPIGNGLVPFVDAGFDILHTISTFIEDNFSMKMYYDKQLSKINDVKSGINAYFEESGFCLTPVIFVLNGNGDIQYFQNENKSYFNVAPASYDTTQDQDNIKLGILLKDTNSNMFIPVTTFKQDKTDNDGVCNWDEETECLSFEDKEYYYTSMLSFIESIRINTKKLSIEDGYFIQKESESSDFYSKINIQLMGNSKVSDIYYLASTQISTSNIEKYFKPFQELTNNNFINYDKIINNSQLPFIIDSGVYYDVKVFDWYRNVSREVNLKEYFNDHVSENNKTIDSINRIILSAENNYSTYPMHKYTLSGTSLGYIDSSCPESFVGNADFVKSVIRKYTIPDSEYYSSIIKPYDLKLNSEQLAKMYMKTNTIIQEVCNGFVSETIDKYMKLNNNSDNETNS